APTAMVRAAVYREVGAYDPARYGTSADLDMWLRIARLHPLGLIAEHLMRYRHFHGSESQGYRRLRVEPEAHFAILDLCLEQGGRALATQRALAAHEAHREEDRLMTSISMYILGDLAGARTRIAGVRVRRL